MLRVHIDPTMCVGVGKSKREFSRDCQKEDHWLDFTVSRLLLQHHPALHSFYSCELGIGEFSILITSVHPHFDLTYHMQLTTFVGFLRAWLVASPGSFTFISGVLPPAVSALFGFFLPIIMRYLSKYQGALTHSRLDRAVVARYFAFLVISKLVIFTLIGVVFSTCA